MLEISLSSDCAEMTCFLENVCKRLEKKDKKYTLYQDIILNKLVLFCDSTKHNQRKHHCHILTQREFSSIIRRVFENVDHLALTMQTVETLNRHLLDNLCKEDDYLWWISSKFIYYCGFASCLPISLEETPRYLDGRVKQTLANCQMSKVEILKSCGISEKEAETVSFSRSPQLIKRKIALVHPDKKRPEEQGEATKKTQELTEKYSNFQNMLDSLHTSTSELDRLLQSN